MARKIADREVQIAKLGEDSLRERLVLAERALVLSGWCAARQETPREKLALRAWLNWAKYIGTDNIGPRANANLDHLVQWAEADRSSPDSETSS